MKKTKRSSAFLSILMAVFILLGSFPMSSTVAYAETYKINTVALTGVGIPRPGMKPILQALPTSSGYSVDTSFSDSFYTNGIFWTDWTEKKAIDPDTYTFVEGHEYYVSVRLIAKTDYEFAVDSSGNSAVTGTINSNKANVSKSYGLDAKKIVIVGYNFGECRNEIVSDVAITGVTPPKAGQKPTYSATINDRRYSINTSFTGDNTKNGIYWWDKTAQTRVDSTNGTFIAGHEYMFQVAIKANTGYEFATNSQGKTDLAAKININDAKVYAIQYQSPKEYVVVDYTFPVLEKQKISEVKVINLTEPKIGEKPAYNAYITGSGYSVKNDFTTTGFKEGVRWVDLTGDGILEHEKDNIFIAGHSYRCDVMLEVKDNYEFTVDSSNKTSVSGTLNGKTAEISGMSGYDKKEVIVVSYTFDELNNEVISKADVTFVTAPEKGKTPSYSVKTGGSGYSVKSDFPNVNGYNSGVRWFDLTDKTELDSQNDTFKSGHEYMIDVILAADVGYEFNSSCTARVNGKSAEVTKIDGFPKKETIRVTYTFDKLSNEIISEVSVTDVSSPKAGEKPVYNAAANGSGYSVKSNYNEWKQGGIYWYDITEDSIVDPDKDLFIVGHEYRCAVLLTADSGYEFADDSEGYSAVKATLNGKTAEAARISDKDAKDFITVIYDFGECKEDTVFTVEFDANGHGTAPESQKVESGKTVKQPDDLTADGYKFLGWYTESECVNKYDFKKEVTADITLFAKWEEIPKNPEKPEDPKDPKDPEDPKIEPDRIYGDLDNDGVISSADSLIILRASVKLENLSELEKELANVDGDDSISSSDALEVLRYSVKLPTNSKTGEKYKK